MDSSANIDRKQRGNENIFPASSRNYNIEIKKGMKILERNWRGLYRLNFN
jgi:hypothetical protein